MFGFLASELPVELCRKPENCSKGHLLKGCNENMAQKVIFISLILYNFKASQIIRWQRNCKITEIRRQRSEFWKVFKFSLSIKHSVLVNLIEFNLIILFFLIYLNYNKVLFLFTIFVNLQLTFFICFLENYYIYSSKSALLEFRQILSSFITKHHTYVLLCSNPFEIPINYQKYECIRFISKHKQILIYCN